MGGIPGSMFESFRVRIAQQQVPAWKVRLIGAIASVIGLVVFLLLLPLILFGLLLLGAWIAYVRLRLWLAGARGGEARVEDGRENVRVLARDA